MSEGQLREYIRFVVDNRGKTPPLSSSGIDLIEVNAISGSRKEVDYGLIRKYVSNETYMSWFRTGHPQHGDILITTVGAIGRVSYVDKPRGCIAQNIISLRPVQKKLHGNYLYYYLSSGHTQTRLQNLNIGVAQPSLKVPHLLDLHVSFPPLITQRKIAAVLSAYDDLIENNLRRIKILEEMAQNLYREWFVQFRFPGHPQARFTDSSLGPIPEGWAVKRLADVAEVNRAQIKSHNAPEELHYIDISSVSPGQIDSMTTCTFANAPGRARRIVQHGDVLWSCVRPNRRSHARVMHPAPNTIASTGFAVLTATTVPFSFLYFATTTDDFVAYLTNNATGAAYPAVTATTFEKADLLIPPTLLLKKFGDMTIPMAEQTFILQRQIQTLRRTRDLLLPRLISGELDVSALDIAVPEEATL